MNNKKLLVVDDDPNVFELIKVNFVNAGYEVLGAKDGDEAISVALTKIPDLILLDITMPKTDGYEVCRKLRETETTYLIPIIVLSAKDKPADKIKGLKLGADDYLSKPFDIEELLARVDNRLQRTGLFLSANPLTGLPGNVSIMYEVNKRLRNKEQFAFLYCDIDHFKPYNDHYGFSRGDDVIKFTAEIMREAAGPNDFVGHVGGDDFIMACDIDKGEERCNSIISFFDSKIPGFYSNEDKANGFIVAKDRLGIMQRFPIMTLSIGMLTNNRQDITEYGKIIEIATELKSSAKSSNYSGKSVFFKDRRK